MHCRQGRAGARVRLHGPEARAEREAGDAQFVVRASSQTHDARAVMNGPSRGHVGAAVERVEGTRHVQPRRQVLMAVR